MQPSPVGTYAGGAARESVGGERGVLKGAFLGFI